MATLKDITGKKALFYLEMVLYNSFKDKIIRTHSLIPRI